MKKISKLALAALVVAAIAGCGGSSSSTTPGNQVNVNGGISTGTATSVTGANATAGPVQITLSDGTIGTLTSGVIPAGGTGFIIPKGAFLFSNLRFPGGLKPSRATHAVYQTAKNGVPEFNLIGTVSSNQSSGVNLDKTIVYPTDSGNYDIRLTGPFEVVSGNTTLSIQGGIDLHFEISGGSISLPSTVTGQLPANNGSTRAIGIALNMTVPGFGNRQYRLAITKGGGNLDKTVTANGTAVTFTDLFNQGNATIPDQGISSIYFGIVPPTS